MRISSSTRFLQRLACIPLIAGCFTAPAAGLGAALPDEPTAPREENATPSDSPSRFLRIVDEPDELIALEIASRTFEHEDDSKPTIGLMAVAHIADKSLYDAIASKLESYDIVLYEAVAPAGVRSAHGETEAERIETTHRSLTFIASVVEQYRQARGAYPENLAALREYVSTLEPIMQNWFHHAAIDAWDRPVTYQRTDDESGYELFSSGPKGMNDGDDGSEEDDRIRFLAHGSVHPMAREENNLQKQLADALGLAYQLEALPYQSSNWRISDMTAEELFSAFSGTEVEFETFSGTLAGTSLPARVVGMLLRFLQMLDGMYDGAISEMVKVLFIEILGDEEMIKASMKQFGADFARILISERNQIVIDDVARILETQPEVESIAILYGAAHMPDMAERLTEQLAYQEDETDWLRAIEVDLTESHIDTRQLMQMRSMVRRMMRSAAMRGR